MEDSPVPLDRYSQAGIGESNPAGKDNRKDEDGPDGDHDGECILTMKGGLGDLAQGTKEDLIRSDRLESNFAGPLKTY